MRLTILTSVWIVKTYGTDRRGKVLTEREVFTHSSGKVYTRVTTNTYDRAERQTASTVVENGKTALYRAITAYLPFRRDFSNFVC